MPPLKDHLGAGAGRALARELLDAWPAFPAKRFTRGLAAALEPLELLARGNLLAHRLSVALPAAFPDAAGILHRALGSPAFDGWMVLPAGAFVAEAGIDEPEVALPLLAALTPRWSSELAVRPFIERHRRLTSRHLTRWARHDDEHVRRLASEGTRPRLPWARPLRSLIDDPSPNVPLLEVLVDDASPYVRRSVANHLNDISMDHPELAVAGAHGVKAPKVFKLTRRRIAPGAVTTLSRRHRFEHVSIRHIHPGPHRIDLQVNGRVLGSVDVEVVGGDQPDGATSVAASGRRSHTSG